VGFKIPTRGSAIVHCSNRVMGFAGAGFASLAGRGGQVFGVPNPNRPKRKEGKEVYASYW
jgi:hypothetical protein